MPVNGTVLAGLVFVMVNLGCSSLSTREWYIQKFGRHSVEREFPPPPNPSCIDVSMELLLMWMMVKTVII